jgi:hypothetical protein
MSAPHRWSKFWWQDWRSDSSLRACSLAARGLWMELLCIAHEGTPYGHVTIGGVAPTDAELARMVGVSVKKIPFLISELERYGVFSRDDNGVIFCRRMIRDNATSEAGRENISKRWGPNGTTPPNRGATSPPTSPPNGRATSPPTRDPYTLEADTEAEEERQCLPSATGRYIKQGNLGSAPARTRVRERTRLPVDWQPDGKGERYAAERGVPLEPTLAAFSNHHAAKGSLMADWQAAWRTWVDRVPQFGRRAEARRNGWAELIEIEGMDCLRDAGDETGEALMLRIVGHA